METTLACLGRDGADRTTLRSVCRELDVAPSLIKHFFAGWHDLLIAAYELLSDRFIAHLASVLMHDFPDSRARMNAAVLRYLSTDWAGEYTIGAHIALWQLGRSVPGLKPAFTRFLDERTRLLRHVVGGLVADSRARLDVDEFTSCFTLLLDGIWLELGMNPGNLSEQRAAELAWFWLNAALPSLDGDTGERKT